MIRTLYYTPSGEFRTDVQPGEFSALLQVPKSLLWVDFEDTNPEEDLPILSQTFRFHPLAIDDALQESHVPKLDDWMDYLYIVLHAVVYEQQPGEAHFQLDTLELDIFLGSNYLVTHHEKPIAAIERVWSACQRDDRALRGGVDHLLYRLADEVVASYMPVIELMDDEIDLLEDGVFNNPSPRLLERIFAIKRAVLKLRRIIGPQREVLNKLARDDYRIIDSRARIYFRDVYDHLVRMQDITESIRDLVSGTLDTYLSVINNRMNDIMKTLTIITTLFMPISFVAGFFGMNYFQPAIDLRSWTGPLSFGLILGVILGTPVAMFFWMHRRGWM